MSLSFEELRAACQRTRDEDCPELGGVVRLRTIPASAGMRLAEMLPTSETKPDSDTMLSMFVEVLASSIVNGELKPICNSDEGREVIRNLPIGTLMKLGQAAMEHSGLSVPADEQKKT